MMHDGALHARRPVLLAAAALLAGCADTRPPPRTSFPPLRYDYLTPIGLGVGTVEVRDAAPPGPELGLPPAVRPAAVLRQMAEDRVKAFGSAGTAVLVIEQASVTPSRSGLSGVMAVRLEVTGADGGRAGYAEARVSRASTGDTSDLRGAAYDLIDRMMDDMNVEFEYQVRARLRDVLQGAAPNAPAPAAVQRQDLAPPGVSAGPGSATPSGPSSGSSLGSPSRPQPAASPAPARPAPADADPSDDPGMGI